MQIRFNGLVELLSRGLGNSGASDSQIFNLLRWANPFLDLDSFVDVLFQGASERENIQKALKTLDGEARDEPKDEADIVIVESHQNKEPDRQMETEFWHDVFGQRPLPESRLSAKLLYAELESLLGGRDHIASFRPRSDRIVRELKSRLTGFDDIPKRHDPIYHHVGLDGLLRIGQTVIEPIFEHVVEMLALKFQAKANIAPLKSKARSKTKVTVRYGGDASNLGDVVRGTIEFDANDQTMELVYSCLEDMLEMDSLRGNRMYLTQVDDRFQRPLEGYMDMQVMMKINGFVCELQLNSSKLLKVKESTWGHGKFEIERKVNDNLIFAAMSMDITKLHEALAQGASPNGSKDMYGLTSLHYAAHHGHAAMVRSLLDAEADVLAFDKLGRMPLRRAVLLGHTDVCSLLIERMEMRDISTCKFVPQGLADLAATALETFGSQKNLPASVAHKIARWAIQTFVASNELSIWHVWAQRGCNAAFLRAMSNATTDDVFCFSDKVDKDGKNTIDNAIQNNATSIVECLLKKDILPLQPHFEEHCAPAVLRILQQHPGAKSELISKTLLEGDNPAEQEIFARDAAAAGNVLAIRACRAGGVALDRSGADGLTVRGRASKFLQHDVLQLLDRYGANHVVDPALIHDVGSRILAIKALGASSHPSAVPHLTAILASSDSDSDVRAAAVEALCGLGKHGLPLIVRAVQRLAEEDPIVRAAIEKTVKGMLDHFEVCCTCSQYSLTWHDAKKLAAIANGRLPTRSEIVSANVTDAVADNGDQNMTMWMPVNREDGRECDWVQTAQVTWAKGVGETAGGDVYSWSCIDTWGHPPEWGGDRNHKHLHKPGTSHSRVRHFWIVGAQNGKVIKHLLDVVHDDRLEQIALAASEHMINIKPEVRVASLNIMGSLSHYAVPHIPILVKGLADEAVTVASAALSAIGSLGALASPAATVIVKLLMRDTVDALRDGVAYRFYRVVVEQTRDNQDRTHYSEIVFFRNGEKVDMSDAVAIAMNKSKEEIERDSWAECHAPSNAIDGKSFTKFFDDLDNPLLISFPSSVRVDSYCLRTGNDYIEADPSRWRLEGSHDGEHFVLAHVAETTLPKDRNTSTSHFYLHLREPALRIMHCLGEALVPQYLQTVAHAISDPSCPEVRESALEVIASWARQGLFKSMSHEELAPCVECVARALHDDSASVRMRSFRAFGALGTDLAAPHFDTMRYVRANDEDPVVRTVARHQAGDF